MMFDEQRNIDYYLGEDFEAPRVFNFHPIHVFLNSDNLDRYEEARSYLKDYEKLKLCCNKDKFGIRDFLIELVSKGKEKEYTFSKIKDGNWG